MGSEGWGEGGRASGLRSLNSYYSGVVSAGFAEDTSGATAVKPWAAPAPAPRRHCAVTRNRLFWNRYTRVFLAHLSPQTTGYRRCTAPAWTVGMGSEPRFQSSPTIPGDFSACTIRHWFYMDVPLRKSGARGCPVYDTRVPVYGALPALSRFTLAGAAWRRPSNRPPQDTPLSGDRRDVHG